MSNVGLAGAGLVSSAESLQQRREKSGGAGGQLGEVRQREVWDLYDEVPELRTACRITARTMRQCRLVLARVNDKVQQVSLLDCS